MEVAAGNYHVWREGAVKVGVKGNEVCGGVCGRILWMCGELLCG